MRQISKHRAKKLREFDAVKRNLSEYCCICGRTATDAAHLLPRSLYPEYYSEDWNIVPMCREHHDRFDKDREFREKQVKFYMQVSRHDKLAANRHFK